MKSQERSFITGYSNRNKELRRLGFSTYSEYLKSNYWEAIKNEAKKRASKKPNWYRCRVCSIKDVPLQLHHTKYRKMDKISFSDVIPLCGNCHSFLHKYQFTKRVGLKRSLKITKRHLVKKICNP